MNVIGVIPARYSSTRLPGKPIIDICGKPMIWWVYNQVIKVRRLDKVFVATDDTRVSNVCEQFNIPVIMTRDTHLSAANRLHEVSTVISADYYLQINGDEPLIDTNTILKAIPETMPHDIEYGVNIISKISNPVEVIDQSNIKVVFDDKMNALYMSRTPIPYPFKTLNFSYYKHVGVIGYNKKMLDFYSNSNPGKFELIEGIDTLRFIDYGKQLQLVEVEDYKTLSVDTRQDLEAVTQMISTRITSLMY